MMAYCVAMIPYANMAPYRELSPPWECQFVPCLPRNSIQALAENDVVAAAVPVGGLAMLADKIEAIGRYGIAAKEKSMSVLFFSDRPLAKMDAKTKIRVTDESASSVRLLHLLFGYRQGFENVPRLAKENDKPNGELIIGDAALLKMKAWRKKNGNPKSNHNPSPYGYVTDLASEWYKFAKLPFVFARWVIRKDAPVSVRAAIREWLAEFQAREEELARQAVPKAADQLGVSREHMRTYFQVIRRTLNTNDIAGQKKFLEEIQKHTPGHIFN